ncbi:DUF6282 family protein [Phreatobacter stygius]|uniref:Amidohydrolase-related domain-containing protein n=1 Tax=Phreatobacter stygius TaxID=1940610 RepID=A0A4D7B306_9HYPH|nr:DUF6282 family protein [Phreatobacter stygius]QCI67251.1 hypothetical protein E8M01_25280 [Phreatobacter stygius]
MAQPSTLPTVVPCPSFTPDRAADIAELLVGAVDLHCHSGPAAMPRILNHHEALMDAAAAKFAAVLYKDHFYPGMAHAQILEGLFPDTGVKLFSGVALNNAVGGLNPYAVDHAIKLGAKIVWMPTFAAANHINAYSAKTFPKTAQKMLDPTALSVLDGNKKLTDDTLQILDLIAEGDIILAGGHLHVSELFVLFEEARRRGVGRLMVNHPSYVIGCSDEDIRGLVALGATMEHSICMFVESRAKQHDMDDLAHLIEVAGVDRTILGSDLGLTQAPRPVDGYRMIVDQMLDHQISRADIRKITSTNAAKLLGIAVN